MTTATTPISVLIADDHQMFGQAVSSMLRAEPDIEVAGVAASLSAARSALHDKPVDVLLMDQRLPDGRGTDVVPEFRSAYPKMRILILSAAVDDSLLAQALRAGCSGYVNKAESVEHLASAVRAAHSGATSISPDVLGRLVSGDSAAAKSRLSVRELAILTLMAEGLSTTEICERAMITSNTLRNHTHSILRKLGVHSRMEAVARAIRQGLVSVPDHP